MKTSGRLIAVFWVVLCTVLFSACRDTPQIETEAAPVPECQYEVFPVPIDTSTAEHVVSYYKNKPFCMRYGNGIGLLAFQSSVSGDDDEALNLHGPFMTASRSGFCRPPCAGWETRSSRTSLTRNAHRLRRAFVLPKKRQKLSNPAFPYIEQNNSAGGVSEWF